MARKLENWLKAYMDYTEPTEAPSLAHMWTGVSTLAGALRRKVWIDMGFFEWTPCFYIILVGRAGAITKSTTINIGMDMLKEIGVNFGPSSVTWEALVSDLAKSAEGVDIYDNGVIETFSPITLAISELGTLLDTKNRALVDVLVDLWDGRRTVWEKKTKTSGNDSIENPWINIIAATTPSWLSDNMPESFIGGGFTSRIVFVYGSEKRHLAAYPTRTIPEDQAKRRTDLVSDLEHISLIKGPYTIEDDAMRWGVEWYEKLHTLGHPEYDHLVDERFDGYKARKQTHMHKLALVIAASHRDERIITRNDLIEADGILTATEKISLPAVFNNIGKTDSGRLVDRILSLVRGSQRIPRAKVIGDLMRVCDQRTILDTIGGLVAAGFIKQVQYGPTFYLETPNVPPETTIGS